MAVRRLLFIHPGPVPPSADPRKNEQFILSKHFAGDLLTTTWQTRANLAASLPHINTTLGAFRYRATCSTRVWWPVKTLWNLAFWVATAARQSIRHGPYDAVVTYGALTTGLAGYIIKAVFGSTLIVWMPGTPWRAYSFHGGREARIKAALAKAFVRFVLRRADRVKLYYPEQIEDLDIGDRAKIRILHDFIPISTIRPDAAEEPYVLFLGYPFHLKGVDVLIEAFHRISERHPTISLKIVGHAPPAERAPFEALAGGNPRIEFHKAVDHERAMELMSRCCVFVLPSRTEGMPRVVLEAMAARRPVVVTTVGAVPSVLRDGETALFCAPDDVNGLARQLDRLLGDAELRRRIGQQGYDFIRAEYDEGRHADRFAAFVEEAVGGTTSAVADR